MLPYTFLLVELCISCFASLDIFFLQNWRKRKVTSDWLCYLGFLSLVLWSDQELDLGQSSFIIDLGFDVIKLALNQIQPVQTVSVWTIPVGSMKVSAAAMKCHITIMVTSPYRILFSVGVFCMCHLLVECKMALWSKQDCVACNRKFLH